MGQVLHPGRLPHGRLEPRRCTRSIDASHAPVAGQTCYVAGCHPATATDSLAETHRNASAVLGGQTRTSCQVCHWNGTPASRECAELPRRQGRRHPRRRRRRMRSRAAPTRSPPATPAAPTPAPAATAPTPRASNFATYHPTTGCMAGACHTSPSKAGYAGNGDCQTCHDGQLHQRPGAREPRHRSTTTRPPTPPSGLSATVSSGGTASATCATCHDPNPASGPKGLAAQHTNITPAAGSPYGPTVACVECHNDTRANGNAEMLAGWTSNACSDCHSIASSAPQHGTTAPVVTTTSSEGCGASRHRLPHHLRRPRAPQGRRRRLYARRLPRRRACRPPSPRCRPAARPAAATRTRWPRTWLPPTMHRVPTPASPTPAASPARRVTS